MINYLAIVLFLLASLLVCYKSLSVKTFSSFVGSSRDIPNSFILFATIFATAIGSGSTFGLANKLYQEKYEYIFAYIFSLIWIYIIAKFFIKRILSFPGYTISDVFASCYSSKGKLLVGLVSVLFSLTHFASQVSACGYLFSHFFDIRPMVGVSISYIFIITYSSLGGIRAIVKTDTLQLIVIFTSIITLLAYLLFFTDTPKDSTILRTYNFFSREASFINSITLTLTFMFMTFYPSFIYRLMLSKNYKIVYRSLIKSIFGYLLFIGLILAIVVIGKSIHPQMAAGQNIIALMVNSLPSTAIKLIAAIGLIAAFMSTADSDLNIATVSACRDVILVLAPHINEGKSLLIARAINIFFGVFAIIFALKFDNLLDMAIFASGLWSPIILVPFLAIIYRKAIGFYGFLFSAFCGISGFMLGNYLETYNQEIIVPPVLIGCITSFISYSCIYIVTKFACKAREYARLL